MMFPFKMFIICTSFFFNLAMPSYTSNSNTDIYYIPINDNTTFELSVFWPSDTESRINELRFSDSVSLSFKTRLTFLRQKKNENTFTGLLVYTARLYVS